MRMKYLAPALLSIAALLVAAMPVEAHHAFGAEFDATRPVLLKGKIVEIEWVNPHTWIHVEVTEDGKPVEWMVEAGSPNILLRRGFTKTTVAVGTDVVVEGYQSKDGSNRANGRDITLPDGKKLFLGSNNGTGAPYESKQDNK